jgi:peptide/nickel transport system permease protein
MVVVVVALGILGRYVASYAPDEMFGAPFSGPSSDHWLGLDFAGRDVLSRFLWGGQTAIVVALAGTILGFVLGSSLGVLSAYRRGWVDELIGRTTDLALAFPALILSLLLLAAFGTSIELVVFAITITTAPGVARIARAATLEVVDLPYVESARARGERASYVMAVEILPSVKNPLLVDFGLRLTTAILLVAALSFVGLGLQPPAADWGLMIGENRIGLNVQPWAVIVPAAAIAALTIGVNLAIDGIGRRTGSVPHPAESRV